MTREEFYALRPEERVLVRKIAQLFLADRKQRRQREPAYGRARKLQGARSGGKRPLTGNPSPRPNWGCGERLGRKL